MKHIKQITANGTRGFTLVELMIALVLGLVLIGGVISVLLSNKQTYRTNNALSQLQDNARTAFELLARDIRQSGSSPCGNTTVTNLLTSLNGNGTDTYIWSAATPIQGFDDATTVVPALPNAVAQSAIVTKGVGVVSTPMLLAGPADCGAGAPIAASPSGISPGDLVLMCDASQAYIYQAGAFAGNLLPMAGAGSPGNATASTGCSVFGNTAYVAQYQPDYWYVGTTPAGPGVPAGTRSLYRARYSAGTFNSDEIARGVSSMQITYLDSAVNPNAFIQAAAVANWANVTAVQVTLTFSSPTNPNNVNNPEPLARTISTTIGIRG
jgi:type IV pilus assembly protein PilW